MPTKKPPPPSYRPTAGFASVTAAVRHFADEGKTPKEIAELTGSTTEAVRGLMQRHRQVRRTTAIDGLTWPQRDKIKRTYLAYLDLMADGLGSNRDVIHHLCRGVHVNKEPAPLPEQKVDEAAPGEEAGLVDDLVEEAPEAIEAREIAERNAAAQEALTLARQRATEQTAKEAALEPNREPEPAAMMVMKLDKRPMDQTSAARFYTLKKSGRYLNLDGSGFTDSRHIAYRGSLAQARTMRLANAVAMGCTISPFEITKKP